MKRLVVSLTALITNVVLACNLVVPYAAGGPGGAFGKLMQDANPNIEVLQYKPGAFAAQAINFLDSNKDYMLAASPMMYSEQNPNQNPAVDLVSIPIMYNQVALTNKGVSFDDLLNKPLMVGIPNLAGSQHLLALELQRANPKLTIVPAPTASGLQLLKNKEIDAYIIGGNPANKWAVDFGFDKIFEIPLGKRSITKSGVTLHNYAVFAIFAHKDASPAQRAKIDVCAKDIVASPKWKDGLASLEAASPGMSAADEQKFLTTYREVLKKNGF